MNPRRFAQLFFVVLLANLWTAMPGHAAPCDAALRLGMVCEAANAHALQLIRTGDLEAVIVMQNVQTGGLIAFAASDPAKFDVGTALLPLSPVKLMAAASWLDHDGAKKPGSNRLLTDSIANGNDNVGRQIASTIREAVGTEKVLEDLARYGFSAGGKEGEKQDRTFWFELAPRWRDRLTPATSYHSLGKETTDKDWEDTLSIGEERFVTTALHLSRFLQAVGNHGVLLPAVAIDKARPGSSIPATTIMSEAAALKLREAMRGAVDTGTAKSAKPVLAASGWTMGGKTGTGPDPNLNSKGPGPGSDGCFAGLIFDPKGKAQFTVVTFVKHGGFGGGNAARISAELARFIIGEPN